MEAIKVTIILICLFSVVYGSSTYGDLAKEHNSEKYSTFVGNLGSLTSNVKPGDLGNLRKSIISTRSFLDVFVYAYNNDITDIFKILRKELNKLYTDIGNFDDLQHVNYSPSDAKRLLEICLKDKDKFNKGNKEYNYESYVKNPNLIKLYDRPKSELSIDFWGNITYTPEESYSGLQNLGLLVKGQLENLIDTYHAFINLTDIYDPKTHDQFHAYRKLLRGFNFITSYFNVFNKTVEGFTITKEAYSKIGKINDEINEYEYYTKKGNEDKANKIKSQLISDWKGLVNWLDIKKFYNLLNYYLKLIL